MLSHERSISLGKTFASNDSTVVLKPQIINIQKVQVAAKKKKKVRVEPRRQTLLLKRIQKLEKENKPSGRKNSQTAASALDLSPRPAAESTLSMKIKKNLAVPSSIRGAGFLHRKNDSQNVTVEVKKKEVCELSQGDCTSQKRIVLNSCTQQGLDF